MSKSDRRSSAGQIPKRDALLQLRVHLLPFTVPDTPFMGYTIEGRAIAYGHPSGHWASQFPQQGEGEGRIRHTASICNKQNVTKTPPCDMAGGGPSDPGPTLFLTSKSPLQLPQWVPDPAR
jgi:hypothetical protein